MTGKKIICFVPYGFWTIHHQVDAVIGAALRFRGSEVCVLTCDGVFENCPISGGLTKKDVCQKCNESAVKLFSYLRFSVVNLRSLLNSNDLYECRKWAKGIPVKEFLNSDFEGAKIGEWVCAGVHSFFLTGHLDFENQNVVIMNRVFLFNGALLKRAYDKLLRIFHPDHVICYSGIHAYYRIFLELSRQRSISVLVHEGGTTQDTFIFRENESFQGLSGMQNAWKKWKEIPLNLEQCLQIKKYYSDNYQFFYQSKSDPNTTRRMLRIPTDSRIILLFTSGNWEIGMARGQFIQTFDTQIDFIRKIADEFASRNEYLVIRHHPSNVGSSYTDSDFLQRLFVLNRELPQNVRVIMPGEKISSYAIAWNADGAISFGSTIGIEVAMRGISTYSTRLNLYTALEIGIEMIKSPSDCGRAIDDVIAKTQNFNLEYLRRVYRSFYFSFKRFSYKFKSFNIHHDSWPSKAGRKPNIRIKNFDELSEGNDPSLDHICNHILHNTPLFQSPNEEERNRSEKQETEFLEKEFEDIMRKRTEVRNYLKINKNYQEPLLSSIHIRQDGVLAENTVFCKTVEKSRHSNIEQIELNIPFPYKKTVFLHALGEQVNRAEGDFVYLGLDNIHIDESLFSTAIDFLVEPENTEYDGIVSGAWVCDRRGNLTDELFTERKDTNDFVQSISILPLINNPVYLLTLFVWRRLSLLRLLSVLQKNISLSDNLSNMIFEIVFLETSSIRLHKMLVPMITIYDPDAIYLKQRGIECYSQSDLSGAEYFFKQALAQTPGELDLLVWLGKLYYDMNRYQESLDCLTHATQNNSKKANQQ